MRFDQTDEISGERGQSRCRPIESDLRPEEGRPATQAMLVRSGVQHLAAAPAGAAVRREWWTRLLHPAHGGRGGPEDDMAEAEFEEENVECEKYDGEKMPQDIRRCSWAWRDVSSTRDDHHSEDEVENDQKSEDEVGNPDDEDCRHVGRRQRDGKQIYVMIGIATRRSTCGSTRRVHERVVPSGEREVREEVLEREVTSGVAQRTEEEDQQQLVCHA